MTKEQTTQTTSWEEELNFFEWCDIECQEVCHGQIEDFIRTTLKDAKENPHLYE